MVQNFRSRKTTEHMQDSVGSRSTITHLGTCLPAPVSEKNLSSTKDGMFVAWVHMWMKNENNDKAHLRHGIALSDVSDLELHMHHLWGCLLWTSLDLCWTVTSTSRPATCWTRHLHHWSSCQTASDHQVEYHAPSRRVPSRRCRSAHLARNLTRGCVSVARGLYYNYGQDWGLSRYGSMNVSGKLISLRRRSVLWLWYICEIA